jgi:hypothetical protein
MIHRQVIRVFWRRSPRKLLGEVMRAVDIAGVESLTASDILVNAPINKVVDLKNIIGRLKANQISYESAAEEVIDFVGVRGDMVVIMGEEILRPNKDAPYAGKTIHRRSTDVWKPFDGVWKLWIRQATITKAE